MSYVLIDHISKILQIDEELITNNKNKNYKEIENNELRQKILIINTYYSFIENKDCVDFIEKCNDILIENLDMKINKDFMLILSIIILKSFLEKKKIINISENYINSDEIFNYCFDQFSKYLIYNKIYMTEKSINTVILYSVDLLVQKKIIKEKIITIKGHSYKTYKYFSVEIKDYVEKINFNYSYLEFKWLEVGDKYYIHSLHYSKMYEVNKKNFNSNKSFKIKDKNYIIKKINLKLYVDNEYQEYLKKKMKNEKEYIKNIEETYINLNELYKKDEWSPFDKENIAKEQKKLASLIEDYYILKFTETDFGDNYIIFPLFMDFRGRKYYSSIIGPTNSKLTRLSYYYGYYDQSDFNEKNNEYSLPFYNTIEIFCKKNNINHDKKFYECIFWSLIGIGKFFINKNKYPINLNEFLEEGIKNYESNSKIKLTIEKELEIYNYEKILKSLWNLKIKKRIIIKDATASINQIFMKKLEPINQNSLNYVNLGNENKWYDTYLVYREKFYEKYSKDLELNEKEFNKLFQRKLIKKTIMTIPYSAGFNLCWKNYIDELKNENIEISGDLKKKFKKFYFFIKNEMQNDFLYKKNTQSLIEKMNEDFESIRKYVLESKTGIADISYYKMKKSSLDKKYFLNGEYRRITRLILEPTSAIDLENFKIASGANSAHFYDSDEIREIEINLKYTIITIHDSYLIDFNNCTKLIKIKIKHYQKTINKTNKEYLISNIFILL